MSMFVGLDHLDIAVENPEAMADFLISLGFVELRRIASRGGTIELRFPGGEDQPFIELRPTKNPKGETIPAGLRHMALRAENLEQAYADLEAKGYQFTSPPRAVETSGRTLTSLIDPEGGRLQLVSR